ncbi:GntR family transcriptional regulator [Terriglobus sp. ADX1]|uniref:GntR family transcriptional regulator n=1 Tax=Terriglobus sp. ADX1 TaxID=2794063 RepID=UPI002FE680D6
MTAPKPKTASSLTEHAHQSIKRHILSSDMTRGERLTEEFFSRELGISKSPVREAMNSLEREGLLRIEPRRGAFVRTFSEREIADLYTVREILEVHAATNAELTEEFVEGLRTSVERTKEALLRDDKAAHIEEDIAFHAQIVQAAGNAELTRVHANIQDKLWLCRCQTYQITSTDTPKAHGEIVECFAAGDRAGAIEAVRGHIQFVSKALQRAQAAS